MTYYFCYCRSVFKACPTLYKPVECSMPGSSVLDYLPESAQIYVHRVSDAIQSFYPLPLPSIFPSIRVFSNELGLRIRLLKCWSFSISPYNEYSGLIFYRIDWFYLLAVQGTLKSIFSSTTIQ